MTYPGGLSTTGFQAETTKDVQTSIENDELATIDAATNLSPTQPLGQMNGIFASAAANIWALLQAIYAAIDPGGAVGVQLDNICALTGVTRLPATVTQVLCTVNLNAGTYVARTLTVNIAGLPQFTFVNRDTIVAPGGSITGTVWVATSTGPIACNSGTLTVISPAVGGFNSITNPANGTTGTNIETDTQLRIRRAALLVAAGGCTIDSIRASLFATATAAIGLQNVSVLENNTMVTDGNGQPAKSFQVLIWDGASPDPGNAAKFGQAIWNSKPSGIQSYGTTSQNAIDASGKTQTVFFTRVTQLPIFFTLNVKTNPNTYPTNGDALVAAALAALGAQMLPGGTVFALQYEAAAFSVQGVLDVTSFFLDVVPSPALTANIIVSPFQLATVSTANITVTHT